MNINTLEFSEDFGATLDSEIREHQEILLKAGVDVDPGIYVLIPEGPDYPASMQVWSKAKDEQVWVHIDSAGELLMSANPLLGAS